MPHRSPSRLIIVCGLSFAGKSTLADAICARFGYPQVDVDDTKLDLFGPGRDDADLSPDEWMSIYRATDDRIVAHLRHGDHVVDASRYFRRRERDHARSLAERTSATAVVIHVDTPESLARQRWSRNRRTRTRRDVSAEAFDDIRRAMEPPSAEEEALVFRPHDTIAGWLAKHAGRLAG